MLFDGGLRDGFLGTCVFIQRGKLKVWNCEMRFFWPPVHCFDKVKRVEQFMPVSLNHCLLNNKELTGFGAANAFVLPWAASYYAGVNVHPVAHYIGNLFQIAQVLATGVFILQRCYGDHGKQLCAHLILLAHKGFTSIFWLA